MDLVELKRIVDDDDDLPQSSASPHDTGRLDDAGSSIADALASNKDLRAYAEEIDLQLKSVEKESIADYIHESEGLAGLHHQIKNCDDVLDSMESMLRGFQGDLASISAQIKYLQDESLTMNVKLRNRKGAEGLLSSFITQIVVPPELVAAICDAEVNEQYLDHVLELNKKCAFARQPSTSMTSACADIAPELEKLRLKSVQKIRDFLLGRVATLRKKFTNTQILQQSALLKYKGLYHFVLEHAPDVVDEVREAYTTTMSGVYLGKVKAYLSGLMSLRKEVASRTDLLGADEWAGASAAASLFSSRPGHARGDGAFKVGERRGVLAQIGQAPLILAVTLQENAPVHYETIFRSTSTLLLDTVTSEHEFMSDFFGDTDAFDNIFGKSIFHVYENLTQELVASWDAVGCLLLIAINQGQREVMDARNLSVLSNFFHRVQVLLWGRFKAIMEAHVASLGAFAPSRSSSDVHPHFVARRYAELISSLRLLSTPVVEPMLSNMLRVLRTEVERLFSERLVKQHPSRKAQAAFLINNYDLVVTTIAERGARGDDSVHFEQLLDAAKAAFVEEQLIVDFGSMIAYVKQTEPLLMGSDASRVDKRQMELLVRSFHDSWKAGIESVNREVVKSFANFKLGMDILKQVLTQLLLYYTRFLDIVKTVHPSGPPFAQFILSIATLMSEIKHFSRNF